MFLLALLELLVLKQTREGVCGLGISHTIATPGHLLCGDERRACNKPKSVYMLVHDIPHSVLVTLVRSHLRSIFQNNFSGRMALIIESGSVFFQPRHRPLFHMFLPLSSFEKKKHFVDLRIRQCEQFPTIVNDQLTKYLAGPTKYWCLMPCRLCLLLYLFPRWLMGR